MSSVDPLQVQQNPIEDPITIFYQWYNKADVDILLEKLVDNDFQGEYESATLMVCHLEHKKRDSRHHMKLILSCQS